MNDRMESGGRDRSRRGSAMLMAVLAVVVLIGV